MKATSILFLLLFGAHPLLFSKSINGTLSAAKTLIENQQTDSAIHILKNALAQQKSSNDTLALLKTELLLGNAYYTLGKYAQGLEHFISAHDLAGQINHCQLELRASLGLVRIRYALNEKQEALNDLKALRPTIQACGDDTLLHSYYYYQAVINYEFTPNSGDSVHQFLTKSLGCCESWLSDKTLAQVYSVMGENLWVRLKKPDQGFEYFLKAQKHAEKSGDLNAMFFANIKIGSFLSDERRFDEAKTYIELAQTQATKMRSTIDVIYAKQMLARLYSQKGMADSTYETFVDLLVLKDSLNSKTMRDEVADLRTKYGTKQKEEENLKLSLANAQKDLSILEEQQTNQRLFIALVFLVLIALLGLGFFAWRNQRKTLEKERAIFKAQAEGEEKERIRIAQELHDGLGQMLSVTRLNVNALESSIEQEDAPLLQNSLYLIDNAVTEVRNISHALMPSALIQLGLVSAIEQLQEKINNAGKIKLEFDHSNYTAKLSQSTEVTVYRIIQEATNNMIKHAEASMIQLSLASHGSQISLKISDNGKGFDTKLIHQSKGIGWKNMASRSQHLNGKLEIKSSQGKGTEINLSFENQGE